jgi:DUF1680 family protein
MGLAGTPLVLGDEPPAPFADQLVFRRKDAARKVQPFPMTQVRLTGGPLLQAAEWNRAYMNSLPADRLLHNFRVNAGLPSTATPLGGWEDPKIELRGHFTGHYLSACALSHASTGDAAIKEKGGLIVAELAKCQTAIGNTGYLSAFPIEFFDRLDARKKVWAPFYTVHKIMAGMFDMYVCCGNQQALDVLTGMARWADDWSGSKSEAHMQDILNTEYGGMNEVLYNLAIVTRDERWARAGDRFNKKVFLNPLALRRDQLRMLHANTHIPQVIGAARRYEISGDPRFHDAADFFWDTVITSRTYVTGGSSTNELWRVEPGHLAAELKMGADTQECCCAYNMMKLTRHLYEWKADARYIDYYERNLYNHRLGTIQPETGLSEYFLSVAPGAWKTYGSEDQSFWCCTGTAVEEYAKLNDTIYHRDDDGLYVNLFVDSQLHWPEKGIRLRQQTKFPDEGRTALLVEETSPAEWTLRLRVPSWTTAAAAVSVNGRKLEGMASPGSYLNIRRTWKKGDRIQMELPMGLRIEAMPDDPKLQAFVFGPLVLAGELGSAGLSEDLVKGKQGPDTKKLPLSVPALSGGPPKPVSGAPMTFRSGEITFRPIYRTWQRYSVYWET